MARGQVTLINLVNGVLRRLGKTQVASTTTISTLGADTWGGIVRDTLTEAQQAVYKEHDWSTLITSGTFTTSVRTYDLSTSFATFGRIISLVDTTDGILLTGVDQLDIDAQDPELDDAGIPTVYSIQYPDLLFDKTPTSLSYRIRYVRRPTALSANADTSILPEFCDEILIWWVVWQLAATREDATDGGEAMKTIYEKMLARAIGQDRRRMSRVYRFRPMFPSGQDIKVPFPPAFGTQNY